MKIVHLPALLILCTGPLFAQKISTTEWKRLIPSDNISKEIKIRNSNNNLDVAKFKGRYYVAFRTAPTHFPSGRAALYIISSVDLENWTLEHEIRHGYDLREPRFIEYNDKLLFYYFEGSRLPFRFDPRHMWMMMYDPSIGWQEKKNIGLDGYVPWRLRTRNDTLYLSAYYGKGLYSSGHTSDLRLFISTDGVNWQTLTENPQVKGENSEEGEFIFDSEGTLWATVRLESEGSLIACADKGSPGEWYVNYSKYKYDSALMFCHDEDVYVVSRRNVDGTMAKAPRWLPENIREKYNLLKYWVTTKKTALFRLNRSTMELDHIMDFPSTGDTAFPGIVQMDENNFLLMNYSSNIHDKKRNWISGQLGKTYIYWTILKFSDEGNVSGLTPSFND